MIAAWELTMATSWGIAVAESRGVQRSEAEDIAAAVTERLYRVGLQGGSRRPIPPTIGAGVKTAVVNEHLSRMRRQGRRREVPLLAEAAAKQSWTPHDDRRAAEVEGLIARLPASLSETDRLVLRLISRFGMTQAEIARELDLSPMSISRRFARIRSRLPQLAAQLGSQRPQNLRASTS